MTEKIKDLINAYNSFMEREFDEDPIDEKDLFTGTLPVCWSTVMVGDKELDYVVEYNIGEEAYQGFIHGNHLIVNDKTPIEQATDEFNELRWDDLWSWFLEKLQDVEGYEDAEG